MTKVSQLSSTVTEKTSRTIEMRRHLPGEPSMWFFVIGDLIIFVGAFVVLHVACESRLATLRSRRGAARISRDARGSTAGI